MLYADTLIVTGFNVPRSTDMPYPPVGYDISTFPLRTTAFRSKKRLYETPGLVESSSPELDLFSDIKEHSEEETTKIMTETMEQYMSKTRGNYGSGVVRPKINDKTHFELKGKYLKELHENTFSGSTETFDGLAAIQAQLNNLGREIKKVNEKVYAAQVRCELCKGSHYTKDCPLKEEGNNLEEAYYTQFRAPYQPAGQYRVAGTGFYQRNNKNSSKKTQRELEIIKEIRASTDAAIRNQGASIKTLEIQIGQMSKVLQERGIGVHTPYRAHSTEAYFLKQFPSQGNYKTTDVTIRERHKMQRFWKLRITPCLRKKKT
ncbi:formin-like protein 1 [Tanacetum coccineum]